MLASQKHLRVVFQRILILTQMFRIFYVFFDTRAVLGACQGAVISPVIHNFCS